MDNITFLFIVLLMSSDLLQFIYFRKLDRIQQDNEYLESECDYFTREREELFKERTELINKLKKCNYEIERLNKELKEYKNGKMHRM